MKIGICFFHGTQWLSFNIKVIFFYRLFKCGHTANEKDNRFLILNSLFIM